jgi:hypothetical protein
MQRPVTKKGINIIFFVCVFTSVLSAGNPAKAMKQVVFVSDFYQEEGSWCTGNRYIEESDPAYSIAARVDDIDGDVIATEVNNCSFNNSTYEYNNYINPVWSSFKSRTHAVPGNHDYLDNATGFKSYFGNQTYHSFTRTEGSSTWKIIGIDTNLDFWGWAAQLSWLENELANEDCTIVYFHHPRYSSGEHGSAGNWMINVLWDMLYNNNVEVVLSGHDHDYERFLPMDAWGNYDANGVIQIVAGIGGAGLGDFETVEANSDVRIEDQHGIVVLYLFENWYWGQFQDINGDQLDGWTQVCQ